VFRATTAGALYAITVFLIGFILGTIRVLRLAPRLGETTAVIIEAPIMLAVSWFVCRWCVDRLNAGRTIPTRSLMGLVAFLVLMSAEAGLGAGVRSIAHRSACHLRIGGWSDWSGRSGGLRHVPGHSGLAAVGHVRTRLSEQRRFPVQMAFNQLGSRYPFGSRFQQAEPTHLGLGQESSGVPVASTQNYPFS
jgi:hypothetical protein